MTSHLIGPFGLEPDDARQLQEDATKAERQVDIRSASYRVLGETPGHVRYGVWVNGGKCGDLIVRQEEHAAFQVMMNRAGFKFIDEAAAIRELNYRSR